jgi:hypothetical protein
MHYKNGREAKNGDKVVMAQTFVGSTPVAGILYDAVAGNDTCNGRIAITTQNDPYANLKECLHVEDVAAAYANPPKPEPSKTITLVSTWTSQAEFDDKLAADANAVGNTLEEGIAKARAGTRRACALELSSMSPIGSEVTKLPNDGAMPRAVEPLKI